METQTMLKRIMELEESTFLTSDYSPQNSMVLAQARNIHYWNIIESLEINPHTYGQLIFDRGGKNIQWRKDNLLSFQPPVKE